MMIRTRGIIAVLALLIPILFFSLSDRYDRAALSKLAHLDQVSLSNLTSSPYLTNSSPGGGEKGTLSSLCDTDPFAAPPLAFGEWLVRKNYTRAYMRPKHVSENTKFNSMEVIHQEVLPGFKSLDRGLKMSEGVVEDASWKCPPVVDVDVAEDHGVEDTSKIIFGFATTVDRLARLVPSLLFSYGHLKSDLLILVPHDTPNVESHQTYFRNRGLNVFLKPSTLPLFTARYFGLVEAFREHIELHRPETTWVSFVDDDTFFPSFTNIDKRLATYDASKKHYIGALSEAAWQIDQWGPIAFGGGGVFISKPLLDNVHEHYQTCQDWGEQPGDQKLAQCIKKYCGTELTQWDTLYQMDVRGVPDGVFESGRQLDSLHHWMTWYEKDVVKMSSVSAAAPRSSILRRWRFDEKVTGNKRSFWVLTNGYSIVRYTIDAKENAEFVGFDKTEKTFDGPDWGFEKRLGPIRPKDQPGVQKERWMLADSSIVGKNVHQTYTREEPETHSTIELIWLG